MRNSFPFCYFPYANTQIRKPECCYKYETPIWLTRKRNVSQGMTLNCANRWAVLLKKRLFSESEPHRRKMEGCRYSLRESTLLFKATFIALGQSYDCPNVSETALKNIGKWVTKNVYTYYKNIPTTNTNLIKLCIFNEIYCAFSRRLHIYIISPLPSVLSNGLP